jgi:DNA polymerase-3 subunit delta
MILFFYGENSYAMRQEVERLKQHYIKKSDGDLNLEVIDMGEKKSVDLLDALAVMPLLAMSRFIIVRGLGDNKKATENIDDILAAVSDSTVMLIEEPKVDRRSVYFKTLSKLKQAKEFKKLSDPQLRDWLIAEATKLGGSINSGLAMNLIRTVGNDQWQLAQEIRKLVAYEPNVSQVAIDELVVPNVEQTIFELTDAVVAQNLDRAMKMYKALTRQGVADQQILAMLVWQYRNIVLASDNLGRGDGWMKDFGISPYAAKNASRVATRVAMEDLKLAYKLIIDADYSIKSGNKDSRGALQDLVIALCSKDGQTN